MNQIDYITKLSNEFEKIIKHAFIKKLPNGKYRVLSEKGKNLGTYNKKEQAQKRLQQIEYFKNFDHHSNDDSNLIDLTNIDEFAYSAIMRVLREKATKEQVIDFLKLFKKHFDKCIKNKDSAPEKIALKETMLKFNKLYKVKFDKKVMKTASIKEDIQLYYNSIMELLND